MMISFRAFQDELEKIAFNRSAGLGLLGAGIGAGAGAAIDDEHRLRGALIGAGLGGAAGYGLSKLTKPTITPEEATHASPGSWRARAAADDARFEADMAARRAERARHAASSDARYEAEMKKKWGDDWGKPIKGPIFGK